MWYRVVFLFRSVTCPHTPALCLSRVHLCTSLCQRLRLSLPLPSLFPSLTPSPNLLFLSYSLSQFLLPYFSTILKSCYQPSQLTFPSSHVQVLLAGSSTSVSINNPILLIISYDELYYDFKFYLNKNNKLYKYE